MSKLRQTLRCSFCRKSQDVVDLLIGNPTEEMPRAYICNKCVKVCVGIIKEKEKTDAADLQALNVRQLKTKKKQTT